MQNGPSSEASCLSSKGMYHLKPVYDSSESIDLPSSMYRLESMSLFANPNAAGYVNVPSTNHDAQSIVNGITVDELERRQDKILARLESLRIEVDRLLAGEKYSTSTVVNSSLCTVEKGPSSFNSTTSLARLERASLSSSTIVDMVVSMDPTFPPLSLFVLYELLKGQFSVLPASYLHSSVTDRKAAARVADVFRLSGVIAANRTSHQLGFTVIWKQDVKFSPSLIVKTAIQTPVVGESSIARYLARLLADPQFYDDGTNIVMTTQLDEIIDNIMAIVMTGEVSSRSSILLKSIGTLLGKKHWILGTSLTLADVIAWSALNQTCRAAVLEGKAPDNVRRWMSTCEQRAEFATARRLML